VADASFLSIRRRGVWLGLAGFSRPERQQWRQCSSRSSRRSRDRRKEGEGKGKGVRDTAHQLPKRSEQRNTRYLGEAWQLSRLLEKPAMPPPVMM
jgi:hypothetical protein